jgi:hypothetical protein
MVMDGKKQTQGQLTTRKEVPMKRTFPLALALTAGAVGLAHAQTPNTLCGSISSITAASLISSPTAAIATVGQAAEPPRISGFAQGTAVVVVGEITSQPKSTAGEEKMQVGIGPAKTDFTLHLKDAKLYGLNGSTIGADDLDDKMWVRAEGTVMDDPRRIKVTRLQVIGKDLPGLRASPFFRAGLDQGYVMAVAGTRQFYPETRGVVFAPVAMTIVGKVKDDTGALETTRKIQVEAAGNTWTLHVPKDTPIFDEKGGKISVHEISEGQWIRAHGWQSDDLRMRVARIQNIGPEQAYRASAFYRTADPIGYVERTPGTGVQFSPLTISGVVTAVNARDGSVTIRDDQGRERVIYTEMMTLTVDGQPASITTLRTGQRVTAQGSEIQF